MRTAIWAAALSAAFAFVSGCASVVMREAANPQVTPAGVGNARVVFMRSSFIASAVGCELFEVVNGELKFIGQLPTGNKVAYETTPGPKVFMANGTAADFMLAELAPGKTYYSIVRPNWGTGGFAPTPIRDPDHPEARGWISKTTLIEPDPAKANAWFAQRKENFQSIYTRYWSRFQNKDAQQKMERTLRPQDGR